ncbi:hypothetical protein LTR09_013053 [Extremus antarcticus]|uniref:RZ-type domain-containing protein n=1 Tax=Extremus antarcticus TaxID=702011 RepID=A0AAJ0D901_9PEZI|nr:hypothetical protein LTR09_013053 [Extremus antarcticus]
MVHFQQRTINRHQPSHKLHEAITHAARRNRPLDDVFAKLGFTDVALLGKSDHRITSGAMMMVIKIDCIVMEDKLMILSAPASESERALLNVSLFSGTSVSKSIKQIFQSCAEHIALCGEHRLPRLVVESTLNYARTVRLFGTSGALDAEDRQLATMEHEKAKILLESAAQLCKQGFRDADALSHAVSEALRLLQREWYEEVTVEELEAIKRAMVTGFRGIATHSGHWYNCANGHPFAIGECGMPMELARCPECGARIGGQSHQAVQGVTRAENMER